MPWPGFSPHLRAALTFLSLTACQSVGTSTKTESVLNEAAVGGNQRIVSVLASEFLIEVRCRAMASKPTRSENSFPLGTSPRRDVTHLDFLLIFYQAAYSGRD